MESIWLTESLVHGQLFSHGELQLGSPPGDYGEMRIYSGSSSSGKMTSVKEETYQIARALGAVSNSRVIANVDHRTVGLLPGEAMVAFADACVSSFTALEEDRGLLKVPNSSLMEVVNFHATSISAVTFFLFAFLIVLAFEYCHVTLHFDVQAMLLARGL